MRVNVYGEELTDRIELVEKSVDEGGEVYTFYGIRFWLRFPNQPWWVHRKVKGELDDDSTAITIWAPTKEKLELMFHRAISVLEGNYAEYGIHEIPDGDVAEGTPEHRAQVEAHREFEDTSRDRVTSDFDAPAHRSVKDDPQA